MRYGSNHEMSLQSRRKYNTGQWIKVEASRVLIRGVETALLKVADDEELSAAPFHLGVPVLELEDARLYIGGLPPDVNIPKRLMTTVPGSFLGPFSIPFSRIVFQDYQGFFGFECSRFLQDSNPVQLFAIL